MKKLSICIPTYNRHKELLELSGGFLAQALDAYEDAIEVVVSDNSDDSVARMNTEALDHRIMYSKNSVNLGYSGNIRKCLSLATGQFLWIISDDDSIVWEGFVELLSLLMSCGNAVPDIVFAPITTSTVHGEKITINGRDDWSYHKKARFGDILKNGRIPFLFIGSGIIRNEFDQDTLDALSDVENDYLHVLMYCSRLKDDSAVAFLDKSLVEYKTSKNVRFSVYSISRSIQFLIHYINDQFHVKIHYASFYSEHLKWLLYHRAGISNVYKGDSDRWRLMRELSGNFTFRSTLLCAALVLPKMMVRSVFACYYAWLAMKKSRKASPLFYFRYMVGYWENINNTKA